MKRASDKRATKLAYLGRVSVAKSVDTARPRKLRERVLYLGIRAPI